MRILVTGGAGYIGSHTVKQLLAGGHDVIVFDSLEYGHRQAVPAERLVVGDLRDIDHLDQLLVVNRIEAVVHFAAYTSVGESVAHPAKYYTNNLIYSLQLLDRCRRNGVGRFVFSSTCAVYGRPEEENKPIVEEAKKAGKPMTFAITFPPGTHAMWTRYWLAAGGINPDKDVTLITIPPAQMVANMKVDKMDGYCVGEPWNARAIADGIGYTAVTTQQIWKDHPEKVLAFTEEFAEKNPKTVKAILRAVTESSQHIDKLENRAHMAEVVSKPQYINTSKEVILGRMLGDYDYGDGRKEKDPNYMTFFDRNTNFPWKSHGVWWISQFRRWGMVKGAPDYTGIVNKVIRPDIYREVAKEMGVAVPKEDMKKETLFDKVEFDPTKPEEYVKKFVVSNVA